MSQSNTDTVKIRFEPFGVVVDAPVGQTLLEAALEAGVHINASCGGAGVCGKCRVVVEGGEVKGGLSEKINPADAAAGIRQACVAEITGPAVVRVPVESGVDTEALKALTASSSHTTEAKRIGADELKRDGRYQPALRKILITAQPPTLDDNRNDVTRLLGALKEQGEHKFQFNFEAIKDLPHAWREGNWTVTVTVLRSVFSERSQILKIEPGDTTARNIAVAIDLGTTTVWAQVVDLNSGEVLAGAGEFNKQISYGEDVISRILYAGKGDGLAKLQKAAADSINNVLATAGKKAGVDPNEICLATIAGNTTMTQLFLAMEPKWIRLEPYVPVAAYYPALPAADFGLNLPKRCQLLAFPAVASYVGGDVVSGVMGVQMHKDPRITLFIDMGTNGEVVVGNQDWMVCAAASAGPAFEGGGIKFGMRAAKGAIESVSINPVDGEPAALSIGRTKPRGICGSGLIQAVGALLLAGVIGPNGKVNLDFPSKRVREGEDGPEYVLIWAAETSINRDITITDIDLDNLMRAKGAMYAAYMTLLEGVGLSIADLERVILAGGFGQSINLERAILIGLLPEMPLEKFTFVGNGSLLGARLITLSNTLRAEVGEIVGKMTNFELATVPSYMDKYNSSMFFPHTDAKTLFPKADQMIAQTRKAFSR